MRAAAQELGGELGEPPLHKPALDLMSIESSRSGRVIEAPEVAVDAIDDPPVTGGYGLPSLGGGGVSEGGDVLALGLEGGPVNAGRKLSH